MERGGGGVDSPSASSLHVGIKMSPPIIQSQTQKNVRHLNGEKEKVQKLLASQIKKSLKKILCLRFGRTFTLCPTFENRIIAVLDRVFDVVQVARHRPP